jgi:hypothetical protein
MSMIGQMVRDISAVSSEFDKQQTAVPDRNVKSLS